jgi:glucose dehydrogenase
VVKSSSKAEKSRTRNDRGANEAARVLEPACRNRMPFMMYIPEGWGSVHAIDVSSGKKGEIKWKFDPGVDRAWAGDVACCGVNNRGVAL